ARRARRLHALPVAGHRAGGAPDLGRHLQLRLPQGGLGLVAGEAGALLGGVALAVQEGVRDVHADLPAGVVVAEDVGDGVVVAAGQGGDDRAAGGGVLHVCAADD